MAWADALVGEGSNLESQQIMRELESHNTSSSEPLDVLKARARELVTTSMIGNLGWAVTEARTNNRLPVEATDHLAYLFQLGKLPDLTCLLLFLMFDIKSHKKIQGFSADKKSACQVASLCSGEADSGEKVTASEAADLLRIKFDDERSWLSEAQCKSFFARYKESLLIMDPYFM